MKAGLAGLIAGPVLSPFSCGADAEVTGTFIGNHQPAKLTYVSARAGTMLDDKPTVLLVFTEKDHSKDKRAELGAMFGKHGSALVVTIFPDDGRVAGCEVAHQAHGNEPFSSTGSVVLTDFKNEGGQLSGRLATAKAVETFGKTWQVDLTFKTKAPYALLPRD